jgi:hypothetical protein
MEILYFNNSKFIVLKIKYKNTGMGQSIEKAHKNKLQLLLVIHDRLQDI